MVTIRKESQYGEFTLFYGDGPFCNFYPCAFKATTQDGKEHQFGTSEQYFMYVKAVTFGDHEAAAEILQETSPQIIKGIGRRVKGFNEKRWKYMSTAVMLDALRAKFSQDADLRFALLVTRGSQLVECSPTDRIWGIGVHIKSPEVIFPSKWRGENRLGKALDKIRDELWNAEGSKKDKLKIEENYRQSTKFGFLYFKNLQYYGLNTNYNFGPDTLRI